ncbi:MAG TPA: hypothetical protein VFZ25_00070 [Chloroflexota bacterium]|nr:hypothetical protein [Chloroflexota bacterium]
MRTKSASSNLTRVLLKARPTQKQLDDRLHTPAPEGLELYLDRDDLSEDPGSIARRCRYWVSDQFVWLVEAPIRTLGGQYFDLTNNDEDHRRTLRRVVLVGRALKAAAANIHVVAPTVDASTVTMEERARRLELAAPLLREYARLCQDAGMIPQVENIPPVGRMREEAYVFSAIGADPEDLLALAGIEPSLRFTVDLSHAGLYLNWCRLAAPDPRFAPVTAFFKRRYSGNDLTAFCVRLAPFTTTVHVSNANGYFGEGTRYADGDFNLEAALRPLVGKVPYFVTETLEADPNRAIGMREAQVQLTRLVESARGRPRDNALGDAS